VKKTTVLGAIVGSGVLLAGGLAFAGLQDVDSQDTVTVNMTARTAVGVMSAARLSPDGTQYIGCYVLVPTATSAAEVHCAAQDSAGKNVGCISRTAAFIQAVAAMNSDSEIWFTADAKGDCTQLGIDTESDYSPKT
jgi:hypothetical protein